MLNWKYRQRSENAKEQRKINTRWARVPALLDTKVCSLIGNVIIRKSRNQPKY